MPCGPPVLSQQQQAAAGWRVGAGSGAEGAHGPRLRDAFVRFPTQGPAGQGGAHGADTHLNRDLI